MYELNLGGFALKKTLTFPSRSVTVFARVGACSAAHRFGDLASGLAIPTMLTYNLKTRLGLAQDWAGMNESTANTALEFHAGERCRVKKYTFYGTYIYVYI